MISQSEIKLLLKAASMTGFKVNSKDLQILYWKKGVDTHKPSKLEEGCFAIYVFIQDKICLKVGKVSGEKNNDRYYQHHYLVKGANSTLAKSLVKNKNYSKIINETNVRDWIVKNTDRYNIIIPKKYGPAFINFAEAFFILKLNPLFEGRKNKT